MPIPEKEGHQFLGWVRQLKSNAYEASTSTNVTVAENDGNRWYKAHWAVDVTAIADTRFRGKPSGNLDEIHVCGSEFQMSANSPIEGLTEGMWTLDDGTSVEDFIAASDIHNPSATVKNIPNTGVTLRWTITDGTNSGSDEITIYNEKKETTVTAPEVSCDGTVTLTADITSSDYTCIWSTEEWGTFSSNTTVIVKSAEGAAVTFRDMPELEDVNFTWNLVHKVSVTDGERTYEECLSDDKTITVKSRHYKAEFSHPYEKNQLICTDEISLYAYDASDYDDGTNTMRGWWTSDNDAVIKYEAPYEGNSNSAYAVDVSELPHGETVFTWHIQGYGCAEATESVTIMNGTITNVSAGDDDFTCTDEYELHASELEEGWTGYWQTVAGDIDIGKFENSTNNVVKLTGLSRDHGEYWFRWYVKAAEYYGQGGCTVSDDVKIAAKGFTVYANWETEEKNSQYTICGSEGRMLGSNPVGDWTGEWTSSPAGLIVGASTDYELKFDLGTNENAVFTWTVTNGSCTDFDKVTVTNIKPKAETKQSVYYACGEDPVTLSGILPENTTGEWYYYNYNAVSSGAFVGATDISNAQYRFTSDATNTSVELEWTVTSTVNDYCSETASVTVINNHIEERPATSQIVCGTEDGITASIPESGFNGYWECTSSTLVTFDESTNQETTVKNLQPGENTLQWTVYNTVGEKCYSVFETFVIENIRPNPATILDGEREFCGDGNIELQAVLNDGEVGEWSSDKSFYSINGTDNSNLILKSEDIPDGETTFKWEVYRSGHPYCVSSTTTTIKNTYYKAEIITEAENLDFCMSEVGLAAIDAGLGANCWWTSDNDDKVKYEDDVSTASVIRVSELPYGETVFTWHLQKNDCPIATSSIAVMSFYVEAEAGEDDFTCTSEYESLNAPALPDGWTGYWECISKPYEVSDDDIIFEDSTNPVTKVSGLTESGTYYFHWTIKLYYNGEFRCEDYDYVQIKANGFTVYADSPSEEKNSQYTICGNSGRLNGTNGTGEWTSTPAGLIVGESTKHNAMFDLGTNESAVFTWTVTKDGCTDSDEVTVTNIKPKAETKQSVYYACGEDAVTLSGILPENTTGEWDYYNYNAVSSGAFVGARDISNAQYSFASNATNTSAELEWTVTSAVNDYCSATARVTVINNRIDERPEISQIVCGTEDGITASIPESGFNGYWGCTSSTLVTFDESTNQETTVKNLQPGENTLQWTVYNTVGEKCYSVFETFVIENISPNPATILDGEREFCGDANIELQAVLNDGEVGKWSSDETFSSANGTDNSNLILNPMYLSDGETTFKWEVYRSGHPYCVSSTTTTIKNTYYKAEITTEAENLDFCMSEVGLAAIDAGLGANCWWTSDNDDKVKYEDDVSTASVIRVSELPYGETVFTWHVKKGDCPIATSSIAVQSLYIEAVAGEDDFTCTSEYESLNAPALPDGWTGYWECINTPPQISTDDIIFENSTMSVTKVSGLTASGTYDLRWTIKLNYNGEFYCENYDEVQIKANAFTVYANSLTDEKNSQYSICGKSGVLSGTGMNDSESTGVWTSSPAGLIVGASTTNNVEFDLGTNESAVLKWTVTENGCTDFDEVTVTNIKPVATILDGAREFCGDEDIELQAVLNDDEVGTWSGSGSSISAFTNGIDNSNLILNPAFLSDGETTITWKVQKKVNYECYSSTTTTIRTTFYEAAEILTNADDLDFCMSEVMLDARGGAPDANCWWTSDNDDKVKYEDDVSTVSVIRVSELPYGETVFTWHVQKGDCPIATSSIAVMYAYIEADAGENDFTCTTEYELHAGELEHGATGYWECADSPTEVSINDISFENSINSVTKISGLTKNGRYEFRWTVKSPDYHGKEGCISHDEVSIDAKGFTVYANIQKEEKNSQFSICGSEGGMVGTNMSAESTGEWTSSPAGLIVGASTNMDIDFDLGTNESAVFKWTVTKDGCTDSDEVTVTNVKPKAETEKSVYYACGDGAVTLSGKLPENATGEWSKSSSIYEGAFVGATDISNAQYSFTSDATNTSAELEWTVKSIEDPYCYTSTTVTVKKNNRYEPTITASNYICGSETSVEGTIPESGFNGYWICTSSTHVTFEESTNKQTTVKNLQPGENTIQWTVFNAEGEGCYSVSEEYVIENIKVVPTVADVDPTFDGTFTVALSASSLSDFGTVGSDIFGRWETVSAPVTVNILNSTNNETEVSGLTETGDYEFKWVVYRKIDGFPEETGYSDGGFCHDSKTVSFRYEVMKLLVDASGFEYGLPVYPKVTTIQGLDVTDDCEKLYTDENGQPVLTDLSLTPVGKYTLKASYLGVTSSTTFNISPRHVTPEITLSQTEVVYDGEEKTPEIISVAFDGIDLLDECGEPLYQNNRNVGMATVTITNKSGSNYTFSKSVNFFINAIPFEYLVGKRAVVKIPVSTTGLNFSSDNKDISVVFRDGGYCITTSKNVKKGDIAHIKSTIVDIVVTVVDPFENFFDDTKWYNTDIALKTPENSNGWILSLPDWSDNTVTQEGENDVKCQILDDEENIIAEESYLVKIDKTAPEISVLADGHGLENSKHYFLRSGAEFSAAAKDNFSGVETLEYSWDNEIFKQYDEKITLPYGKSSVYVRSKDVAGNQTETLKADFSVFEDSKFALNNSDEITSDTIFYSSKNISDMSFEVDLNGNTIGSVTDASGNSFNFSDNVITVKKEYLETLSPGIHPLFVRIHPLGEKSAWDGGNPADFESETMTINLDVKYIVTIDKRYDFALLTDPDVKIFCPGDNVVMSFDFDEDCSSADFITVKLLGIEKETPDGGINFQVPFDGLRGGKESLAIEFYKDGYVFEDSVVFSANYPSERTFRVYDDVLALDNFDRQFVDSCYKWYIDNKEIDSANAQFLDLTKVIFDNEQHVFTVSVLDKDGNRFRVCPDEDFVVTPSVSKRQASKVKTYPNPAVSRQPVYIELKNFAEEDFSETEIWIYNQLGGLVQKVSEVGERTAVVLPSGFYSGVVVVRGQKVLNFKIVVQ